jgi:hypothetical protein
MVSGNPTTLRGTLQTVINDATDVNNQLKCRMKGTMTNSILSTVDQSNPTKVK